MRIKKLKLSNFRNLNSYEIEPGKINLFLGENGVGKTNLVESIHILSVCRSWRTKKDAEIIGWDDRPSVIASVHDDSQEVTRLDRTVVEPRRKQSHQKKQRDFSARPAGLDRNDAQIASSGSSLPRNDKYNTINTARVEAEIISDSGDIIKPAIAQTGEKKHAFISDKQVPVSTLVGTLPTIIFVPENMDLPEASPSKRRRNLDMLIAQTDPKYTRDLLKYNQVLKARNKLLDGINKKRNKKDELDFWDKEMVELGRKIIALRLEVTHQLNEYVGRGYNVIVRGSPRTISHGSSRLGSNLARTINKKGDSTRVIRKLTFEYKSSVENVDRFDEELVAIRDQELRYGNTIIGPHRDDWQLKFDGIDVRMSASRGETRAALLALKMAEMEVLRQSRNEIPILLLDDVFAELDRNHSEAILEFFDGGSPYTPSDSRGATMKSPQIFITATDAEYIPETIKKKAKTIELKI